MTEKVGTGQNPHDGQYQWDAGDYAKNSGAQMEWANELIAKLNLKGDESVLDIGCGDGRVTREIADCLPKGSVVGIDNSLEMIRLAKASFPKDQFANLRFETGDAGNLKIDSRFDIIFSNAALHWVKDHRPVLAGIKKCLKPNGRILLQMGGQGNALAIFRVLETLVNQRDWSPYFNGFTFPYGFYDDKIYSQWLHETGLEPIRVELIPKDMIYEDINGLEGWIRTTWLPYTNRVPDDLKETFINTLAKTYIQFHPSPNDDKIHVGMVRLEAEARNCT